MVRWSMKESSLYRIGPTGAVLPTNRLGAGLYSVEVLAKQYRGVLLFKKE
jgi:hypothetical protein